MPNAIIRASSDARSLEESETGNIIGHKKYSMLNTERQLFLHQFYGFLLRAACLFFRDKRFGPFHQRTVANKHRHPLM